MSTYILLRIILACAGIGIGFHTSRADEGPSEPESFSADLNGDGSAETILRRRSGSDKEFGTFFQIIVKDASGAVLWKSPETRDPDHPLAFGAWHFGISLPQLVGDVDRDGKVELIAPAPQSDVSPTFFRVLQWTGSAFEPRRSRALTGKAQKGALFSWSASPSSSDYWVQSWQGPGTDGGWVVEMVTLPEDGEMRMATGVISAKGDGFELLRWIKPPAKVSATTEPDVPATPAVSYRARLSAADHVNSSGAALKTVMDILRQDRANYHRGIHRDAEDQGDERFTSADARATLAAMPASVLGGSESEARIFNGSPVVQVTISEGAVRVEIVNMELVQNPAKKAGGGDPDDQARMEIWWDRQPWVRALKKSMPRGVTILMHAEPYDAEGWSEVELREQHAPDSGFDPDVSPVIGFFRVSRASRKIEWMEPVSGEYESLDGFLKQRGLK